MKIMIFLHGTATMHMSGVGKTPIERIKQVEEGDTTVQQFENYVPVGDSNKKIAEWSKQGAEVVYLSSNTTEENITKDKLVLAKYNFPNGEVLYRHDTQTYADVAEQVMPSVLIEDNCESIGGEVEMTYPHISSTKQKLIKSIVVKEFSGIDVLPDNINNLAVSG